MTADQAKQQIRQESTLADDADLESWLEEACRTLDNKEFAAIFQPDRYRTAMNELPVLYRHNRQRIYGIVDRLVINKDHVLLIDYKTHRVENETQLDTLVKAFSNQLELYRKGVEKLWPGRRIKSGLLFTHSARLIWIDQIPTGQSQIDQHQEPGSTRSNDYTTSLTDAKP